MKKYNYDSINILIADQNQLLRSSLKGVLHQSGFRSIADVSSLEQMEEHITRQCPDLLLCDIHLPEGDVCQTIHKLRHNKFGKNPFCSVILFVEEPTPHIVEAASQAGLDDLQIKPIVAQKIIKRVEYLVEKRKPFVVTTDYIGPDRRSSKRPGTMEITTIEVPNSISLKANGKFNAAQFQMDVDSTTWEMNAQKIERHAYQISYLVERVVPAYKKGDFNKESMGHVSRLVDVSKDIAKRLEESDYAHIAGLVSTLETVATSLWHSGTMPKHKDLELLPELSAAISATFRSSDKDSLASEIISSVQQNYQK